MPDVWQKGASPEPAVLLVDDHPANLLAYEAVLGGLPCRLLTADSGAAALALAETNEFAVVLMDVQMPHMDGLETTRRLRSSPRGRSTPVILLTAGEFSDQHGPSGYSHGAVDYLHKPFSPDVLRYKVSVFIDLYLAKEEVKRQGQLLQRRERARADEKEALLQLVIEQSGDGIIVADETGTLRIFNPAAERQHGASKQEISAPDWTATYGLYDLEGAPLALEDTPLFKAVQGVTSVNVSWQVRRPDGELRVLLGTATPLRRPDGSAAGGVLITRDITEQLARERERARSEEEIRTLNAQLERRVKERTAALEEANEELESFSYSVSHDLRAPLRHITGFAQLLEKRAGASLDEKSQGYVRTISEAAQRGGQLVDDLLAFSRMGKAELRKTPVSLKEVVADVQRELVSEAEGRCVTWNIGELPDVLADFAMLRVALRNLMANALKYTRPMAEAVIEVGAGDAGEMTHIWVKDNGVGFEMQYVDKLFGIFQRLHTAEQFEGVGIGLANVRRVVSRHGGTTWAEGAVGQGATFHLTLPKLLVDSEQ